MGIVSSKSKARRKRWYLSFDLRTKLLIFSSVFFIIPWIGYQYVQAMEAFLRSGQENSLLATARAVAFTLQENNPTATFHSSSSRFPKDQEHLYLRPIETPIILDGYATDWEPYLSRSLHFGKKNVLQQHGRYDASSSNYEQIMGVRHNYLYVIVKVHDDKIVYRAENTLNILRSDHLRINIRDKQNILHQYVITTSAPGWVNAYQIKSANQSLAIPDTELRIKGEWQEVRHGYNVEFRIPLKMIGDHLSFSVADVDDPEFPVIKSIIGQANLTEPDTDATVTVPMPALEDLLDRLNGGHYRIWVVNQQRKVIALSGYLGQRLPQPHRTKTDSDDLARSQHSPLLNLLHFLYGLILDQPTALFEDELSDASLLNRTEVSAALEGKAMARWRLTRNAQISILSATYPVRLEGEIKGAVMVEQTNNSILLLQNNALEKLLNTSVLAISLSLILLILFASRLSSRVRKLRDQADQAITTDGRIVGGISVSRSQDEIGDLSRSFNDVLIRLQSYTSYLETLKSKLTHEIRTPLSVVQSSLENLEDKKIGADAIVYVNRARQGLDRLNSIVARMSEAARVEQSLQNIEKTEFDLVSLVRSCIGAYQDVYPSHTITLNTEVEELSMLGAPELIAQMLDKLIDNAVEFATLGTEISTHLSVDQQFCKLGIVNHGPAIPLEIQNSLFDSMVSVRTGKDTAPHLGLGLFIARLIVEFHQGVILAENVADGVRFSVEIPRTI